MPLIVKDPRGKLTSAPELARTQLTSSVDVAPLLLTIASGSDEWRTRAPLRAPRAPARPRGHPRRPDRAGPTLRAARDRRDRDRVRDRALRRQRAAARRRAAHADAKYATYSNWRAKASQPLAEGQERELYDYRTGKRPPGAGQQRRRKPAGGLAAARCSSSAYAAGAAPSAARSALLRRARAGLRPTTSRSPPASPRARRSVGPNASSRRERRDELASTARTRLGSPFKP